MSRSDQGTLGELPAASSSTVAVVMCPMSPRAAIAAAHCRPATVIGLQCDVATRRGHALHFVSPRWPSASDGASMLIASPSADSASAEVPNCTVLARARLR